MSESSIQLTPEWKELLLEEFSKPYLLELKKFLKEEKISGRRIYPVSNEIFAAFNITPLANVKVIIDRKSVV